MNKQRKTFFISDLHLAEKLPHLTQQFLRFLKIYEREGEALYILGDLFEAWIGDDDDTPFHQIILRALQSVTQKLPIYFIHGNRDFLIGKKFLKETGCQLLMDETKITLYDTSILLMHGDTLCTEDIVYLKWRKRIRRPFLYPLFFLLSLKIRKNIAAQLRKKSMSHIQSIPQEIMDVTQQEVERIMKKHEVAYLIHGHTHRPHIHHFLLDGLLATRIVLGAWHEKGSALVWDERGEKELITI